MQVTPYAVHVELARRDLTPDDADLLIDELADWHAAIGTSPRGWADVQMTVPAESLDGAIRAALALARQMFDAEPITVSAMTEAEFTERLGAPSVMPDLVGVTDAAEILEVTRQRVLQMIDEGKFSSTRVGNSIAIPRLEVELYAQNKRAFEQAVGRKLE